MQGQNADDNGQSDHHPVNPSSVSAEHGGGGNAQRSATVKRRGPKPTHESVRFWNFVSPCPNTGCWLWVGAYQRKGYGHIGRAGKHNGTVTASRLSYEMQNGQIPLGLFVLHRCDNPSCVNPEHLFLGTNADNMADCKEKGRARGPAFKGEQHPNAKLSANDIASIRSDTGTCAAVGRKFNISASNVSTIRAGKGWAHVR